MKIALCLTLTVVFLANNVASEKGLKWDWNSLSPMNIMDKVNDVVKSATNLSADVLTEVRNRLQDLKVKAKGETVENIKLDIGDILKDIPEVRDIVINSLFFGQSVFQASLDIVIKVLDTTIAGLKKQ